MTPRAAAGAGAPVVVGALAGAGLTIALVAIVVLLAVIAAILAQLLRDRPPGTGMLSSDEAVGALHAAIKDLRADIGTVDRHAARVERLIAEPARKDRTP